MHFCCGGENNQSVRGGWWCHCGSSKHVHICTAVSAHTHQHKHTARRKHAHRAEHSCGDTSAERCVDIVVHIYIYIYAQCPHTHILIYYVHTHTHTDTGRHCTYATDLVSHSQIHNGRLTMADPGDMFCVSKDIWISQPTFTFAQLLEHITFRCLNQGLQLRRIHCLQLSDVSSICQVGREREKKPTHKGRGYTEVLFGLELVWLGKNQTERFRSEKEGK